MFRYGRRSVCLLTHALIVLYRSHCKNIQVSYGFFEVMALIFFRVSYILSSLTLQVPLFSVPETLMLTLEVGKCFLCIHKKNNSSAGVNKLKCATLLAVTLRVVRLVACMYEMFNSLSDKCNLYTFV